MHSRTTIFNYHLLASYETFYCFLYDWLKTFETRFIESDFTMEIWSIKCIQQPSQNEVFVI